MGHRPPPATRRNGCYPAANDRASNAPFHYLIPIAYPRFGPNDASWNTSTAYTRLASTGSRRLPTSDGRTG